MTRTGRAAAAGALVASLAALGACSSSGRPRDGEPRAEPPALAGRAAASDAAGLAAAPDAAAPDAAAPDAAAPDAAAPESPPPTIVEAPMAWSDERARLTLEYRRRHSDRAAQDVTIDPRVIVLHYTAAGTARSTQHYFDRTRLDAGGRPELARGGAVNVSAHFLVDRDGTILRLQPETRYARHCIGLNHLSIGIENVGDEAKWPLTDAQVAANAALIRELSRRFRITHLLGHHEVAGAFAKHPYFVELDPRYTNRKPDPGARFMARVREAVAELGLADR